MTGIVSRRRDCQCPRAKHQHGSVGAYLRDRCRCLPCRLAKHYATAAYRDGESWREQEGYLVPRIGTVRRLRALMALGYSAREIGQRCALSGYHVQNLRNDRTHPSVTARIALAVARVYDDLWDKPCTSERAQAQRTKAAQLGYLLPMAWDDDTIDEYVHNTTGMHAVGKPPFCDEIAVQEAIIGRRVGLTRGEMAHAIARLGGMGYSAKRIAERLGTTQRTVVRHRAKERAA